MRSSKYLCVALLAAALLLVLLPALATPAHADTVSYTGVSQNGGDGVATTELYLHFSADPGAIAANDIALYPQSPVQQSVVIGAVTGAGTTRTLTVSGIAITGGGTSGIIMVMVKGTTAAGTTVVQTPAGPPLSVRVYITPPTYTVTFSVVGGAGGTLTAKDGGMSSGTSITSGTQVAQGRTVYFEATPDAGMRIKSFTVNGQPQTLAGNGYTHNNLSAALTVTVEFENDVPPDPHYQVAFRIQKDGQAWSDHAKTFTLHNINDAAKSYPITASGNTISFSVPSGSYALYEDNSSNGITFSIGKADTISMLNYYTIRFSVQDDPDGTSSGSTTSATYGGAPISSGAVVLAGQSLAITVAAKGSDTYEYAWYGKLDQSGAIGQRISNATTAVLENSLLSTAVNVSCTVKGITKPPVYGVTLYVYKDNAAWSGHGKTFSLKKSGNEAETVLLTGTGSGLTGEATVGNWKVYDTDGDTGVTLTITDADGTAFVNYYTIRYSTLNAGTAKNSAITATYDGDGLGEPIVLAGKKLMLTAVPNITGIPEGTIISHTYAWYGTASGTDASYSTTVNAPVDALCIVTGTTRYAVHLGVYKDGQEWANSGKSYTLKLASDESVTATMSPIQGTGAFSQIMDNGVWIIYENGNYTGRTIFVNNAGTSSFLYYCTLSYSAIDAGLASGSTISALYNGKAIASGSVVLCGNTLAVTAAGTGAGAAGYSYAWGGTASGTGAVYTYALPQTHTSAVNAVCTVTGLPAISGTAVLAIDPAAGALTASVNGGSGTYSYAWAVAGQEATLNGTANGSTYTPAASELGKLITCTITKDGTVGELTKSETVYKVAVTPSGNVGADAASIASPYGKAGDTVNIAYTLGTSGTLSNSVAFTGGPVTDSGTSPATYVITAADAANGVVTLTATFTHTDIPPIDGTLEALSVDPSNGKLTATVSGGSGTYIYTWTVDGQSVGSNNTYTPKAADLGKLITCTVTKDITVNELTESVIVYKTLVFPIDDVGTDAVIIKQAYGKAGDSLKIAYTVDGSGTLSNTVSFTGGAVADSGISPATYVIAAADARQGIITLTATFTHSNKQYAVIYDLNGGKGTAPVEATMEKNTVFAAAATTGITAPAGKKFKEWNTQKDGKGAKYAPGSPITMPEGDLTLYAIWANKPAPSTPAPKEAFFRDVDASDGFYDAVYYVYINGLMDSTGDAPLLFSPDTALTRAEAILALYRMAGSPDAADSTHPFADVSAGKAYTDAVKWAVANGILSDNDSHTFAPEDSITREALAALMHAYQRFTGETLPEAMEYSKFADWDNISSWAQQAAEALARQGIMSPKPGNLFDPLGEVSRAEFAVMLHRVLTEPS